MHNSYLGYEYSGCVANERIMYLHYAQLGSQNGSASGIDISNIFLSVSRIMHFGNVK